MKVKGRVGGRQSTGEGVRGERGRRDGWRENLWNNRYAESRAWGQARRRRTPMLCE